MISTQRYLTLCEIMKRFRAELFALLSSELSNTEGFIEGMVKTTYSLTTAPVDLDKIVMPSDIRQKVTHWPVLEQYLRDSGLVMCARTAQKMATLIAGPGEVNLGQFRLLVQELKSRLADEPSLFLYYSIEPDKRHLVDNPNLFGESVAVQFPSAAFDIREAGQCLAFDRYPSSVFHSMKVLETGLVALGRRLKVNVDVANWHEMLVDIEKAIKVIGPQDGPDWRTQRQFYSEAAVQFRYFKDAWRNHVMHVRSMYGEEQATQIFDHVKGFMEHLANGGLQE